MKSNNKEMNLEELKADKKYSMIVEFELPDGDTMEEEVTLKKNKSGIIEISGFSPSGWGGLYNDGPNFCASFTEVNWALIILELAQEMSDDLSANSFKLKGNGSFEFTFGINAKSMEDVVSKVQLFFSELYRRSDKRWDDFQKLVDIK